MRWDAQRLDLEEPSTLPGMPSIRGLLRSVQVPEFPGLTFHEVRAKSALNHVPGESAMPFPWTINPYRGCSHSCVYCVTGDTLVLMVDGSQRRIAELRLGDSIVGTEERGTYRHYVETQVLAHWSTVKPAHRVSLADGTTIDASGDHRFLTRRGWKHVTGAMSGPGQRPYLTTNDSLLGFGRNGEILERTRAAFTHFGFDSVVEDPGLANGVKTVRLRGGLREHMRFLHLVDPAIRRKCSVQGIAVESNADLRVVGIEPLGKRMRMYDITTGTGDFIANGVISHNCFARRTHEWLELDSGHDFDSQIVVKTNLVDVLRRELARPSWAREHVALGTNTDPYQRAEGRYRLMPGVIGALADSGTPFSILTKGTLLRRDIPLLVEAARKVPVGLGVSMAIWDDDLHAALEPGVPTPRVRLDLVKALTNAGLPCGVFLAPVLPGLTDDNASLDAALGAIAAAGASGVTVIPLHLRPGAREWFMAWLRSAHPELVPRYERLYARRAYVPAEYRTWLQQQVAPLLRKHGLDRQSGGSARAASPIATGVPGDEEIGFPAGSLPSGGMPGVRPQGRACAQPGSAEPVQETEQLSLL
jgi:DNA repair photolyase